MHMHMHMVMSTSTSSPRTFSLHAMGAVHHPPMMSTGTRVGAVTLVAFVAKPVLLGTLASLTADRVFLKLRITV